MKDILIFVAVFLIAMNWQSISVLLLAGDIDYDAAVAGDVTLYSTAWCGYCRKTKTFLERHDIPYTEYDVEKTEEGARAMQRLEAYGVPVVTVGEDVIYGYRLRQLARALDSDG